MAFTPNPPIPDRADKLTFPSRMYNMWVWFVATIAELSALGSAYNLATSGTSSTSNTIGTGSKNFTVAAGLGLLPGMPLNFARTSAAGTTNMFGYVVSYSGTSLVYNAVSSNGSGTYTDWTFSLAASAGGATLGANIFTALQRWAAGSNIASAATIDLTAANGNTLNVTGTTATSAFTITAGQWMWLMPTGAWPLTYHATNCNIEGGANYTCEAGDRVFVSKAADGVVYVNVVRKNGKSVIIDTAVPVRQALQYGPYTTTGQPNLIPQSQLGATLATGVTLKGSTAAFMASVGNGFNTDGTQRNLNKVRSSDLNIPNLTASVTNYIWYDTVTDTAGFVVVADAFQAGGTIPVTNNQYTYDYLNHIMYLGNGSSASQSNRIIVAEVDTNATVITAIRVRAYAGFYDSGFTATLPAAAATYSRNHNMGTNVVSVKEVILCTTADGNYAVGDLVTNPLGSNSSWGLPPAIAIKPNIVTVRRPNNAAYVLTNNTTGALFSPAVAASWSYKLVVTRDF